ncbi:hypothetical protein [Brasilonema sp. UFV-L1]|uniref:hypothetical protein n=1 Tax=Brasilonema sp. UFV-L1 TaxID=2234130 RepID=UPI0030D81722
MVNLIKYHIHHEYRSKSSNNHLPFFKLKHDIHQLHAQIKDFCQLLNLAIAVLMVGGTDYTSKSEITIN